ncbi:MAG: hypothetical protein M1827_000068 [Pycnora praestabilis]|nr:MAG: hypothetical protein M1827_000068 [Pycnora praestabilis]
MSAEPLPGRPGNLTPEQETKLRDFWLVTLGVFGVHSDHTTRAGNGKSDDSSIITNLPAHPSTPVERQREDTLDSEKKKKKRISLFGRKHHKDDKEIDGDSPDEGHTSALSAPTAHAPSSWDTDDKFGQTKDFKEAIASQSPADLRAAFWSMVKHDHPDGLMLRFLRARKWDAQKALIMLISTMHWRLKEMHVDDDVIKKGEGGALEAAKSTNPTTRKEGEDFLAQLRMGKSFLHGVDKEGRPMCFVRVRLHRQGEQSEASLERYTVYIIETARLFLTPAVDTAAVVFDMTGFSMANMDYTPVKFMIRCFEANYPESLGVVLVHKSPWIFQGIWSIIKGWLDPVVASKVHFTKNVEELERYVSRNHILKELGGDEDWTYRYVEPIANENYLMSDGSAGERLLNEREQKVKEYERATLDWISGLDSQYEMAAKRKERNRLAEDLRVGYWRIDPYTRARTLYDRVGIINDGGHLDPYLTLRTSDSKVSGKHSSNKTYENDLD